MATVIGYVFKLQIFTKHLGEKKITFAARDFPHWQHFLAPPGQKQNGMSKEWTLCWAGRRESSKTDIVRYCPMHWTPISLSCISKSFWSNLTAEEICTRQTRRRARTAFMVVVNGCCRRGNSQWGPGNILLWYFIYIPMWRRMIMRCKNAQLCLLGEPDQSCQTRAAAGSFKG